LFWESWSFALALFEGQGQSLFCSYLYLMLNLRPYFLGWVLDFCSLKADFSFLKYVFQNQRFVGWFRRSWWFQFFAKTNQNQRTASSSSWKESESKNHQFWFFWDKKMKNQRATTSSGFSLKTSQETPVFSKELG